ncbi:hypothetical protein [Candidatus Cyanaurora vandensis]|uniref:hypothetical protein n=1 Tax=Candidatus Cyanaurora vandensis TaxID=2714958 RepID=UPI00257EE87A|nr:hypothetical protein [Candidatus Cyanaurora vandensis]
MPSPQIVLDPQDRQTSNQYTSSSIDLILPLTRQLGLYPNTDDWLPGDLLLVGQIERNWTHEQIFKYQMTGGYPKEHARWGHAAIYLGDGEICEAMPTGVQHRSIENYIDGKWLLRVRRDPLLNDSDRWRIVIRGLTKLRMGYGFFSLMLLYPLVNLGFNTLN